MTHQEILDAIPHRDPFLLVDEIVEQTEKRIVGTKTFSGKEWFFAGHFPGQPIVPGVLLCEAAMQCGAILMAHIFANAAGTLPVVTRMNDVRFKRMVAPGEKIVMEVELKERLANHFYLVARSTVEGKVALRLEFACAATEATKNA